MTQKQLIKRLTTLRRGVGDVMHNKLTTLIRDISAEGVVDDLNIRDEQMAPKNP